MLMCELCKNYLIVKGNKIQESMIKITKSQVMWFKTVI